MKKYLNKKLHYLLPLILPAFAFAQNGLVKIQNPIAQDNVMDLISAILNKIIVPIGAVVVVIAIIYSGFTFVRAQGKPAEIDKAKQRILWTLIGAAVLLGAATISTVVKNTIEAITK